MLCGFYCCSALFHHFSASMHPCGTLFHHFYALTHQFAALIHCQGAMFQFPGALFHQNAALSHQFTALTHRRGVLSFLRDGFYSLINTLSSIIRLKKWRKLSTQYFLYCFTNLDSSSVKSYKKIESKQFFAFWKSNSMLWWFYLFLAHKSMSFNLWKINISFSMLFPCFRYWV